MQIYTEIPIIQIWAVFVRLWGIIGPDSRDVFSPAGRAVALRAGLGSPASGWVGEPERDNSSRSEVSEQRRGQSVEAVESGAALAWLGLCSTVPTLLPFEPRQ